VIFENLSSNGNINRWINESYRECRASYPLPKRGRVAFDIGANVGGFCIHAHKNFDKIYAFEPMVKNYNVLCDIIEKLRINNVEAFNTAVYSEDNKSLPLRIYAGNHTKDITCADFEDDNTRGIGQQCETISLKSAMDSLGLSKLDYLKLDCEGSEYSILENFYDYDRVSWICMEIHGFYGLERKNNLLEMLQKHYYLVDVNTVKGFFSLDEIMKNETVNNFELLHNILLVNRNLKI